MTGLCKLYSGADAMVPLMVMVIMIVIIMMIMIPVSSVIVLSLITHGINRAIFIVLSDSKNKCKLIAIIIAIMMMMMMMVMMMVMMAPLAIEREAV